LKLAELIKGFNLSINGDTDIEVNGICCDTRKLKEGDMFCAVAGGELNGADFIPEAIAKGAAAILAEEGSTGKTIEVPVIEVNNVRDAIGPLAARFYKEPTSCMDVAGITGTNGKTTVAYIMESIFNTRDGSGGVVGTISYRYGGREYEAPHTTPEAPVLQELFKDMREAGTTHVAVEVSSHAIYQRRINGTNFAVKIFTNLTPEHLDFHGTMDEYYGAKSSFFVGGLGVKFPALAAVINMDDEWGERLFKDIVSLESKERVTEAVYGYSFLHGADIFPETHELSSSGIKAELVTPWGKVHVNSHLVGEYNLSNIMAAVGGAMVMGFSVKEVEEGLKALSLVPGRLENICEGNAKGVTALVDYAHTPDAIERTLSVVKDITKGRIITVFGCGGDRDKSKRAEMGKITLRLSDITIVTSDNPRREDPLEIIKDIEAGMGDGERLDLSSEDLEGLSDEKFYAVEVDRETALRLALKLARKGDTLLVAGKGHEDYQIIGSKKIHLDDREILSSLLSPDVES
jgi:UDP-N-acetylmuramoyl-L-alanyl-D-glutamate--2,6-diaminopimelate ligase